MRDHYCNSLFVCMLGNDTSSSSTSARCCRQTSVWRVSSDAGASSPEAPPLAASVKPNTVQTRRSAVYLGTHCNIGSKRAFLTGVRTRQVTQLFTYELTHKLFTSCIRRCTFLVRNVHPRVKTLN